MIGTIGFEELCIDCIIGIMPEERSRVQSIYVDLKVEADFSQCVHSDHMHHSINYVEPADLCIDIAKKNQFQLLETFANAVLESLLARFCHPGKLPPPPPCQMGVWPRKRAKTQSQNRC